MSSGSIFKIRRSSDILILAALVISGLSFAFRYPQLVSRVLSPVQVQQEEAVNVEFGRLLSRGQTLYPDITQGGPYFHCSYPPLFPFLESLLSKVIPGLWLPGRLLALAGFLGCGFLLGWVGWHRWGVHFLGLLLPLLLWMSPTWESWGSMVRLDTLLYFFNFASFLILLRRSENIQTKGYGDLIAAGFLNAAAILMKPTAVTLLAVFVVWALPRRQFKALGCFVLSSLGPVLMVVVFLQGQTHGMFWTDTVRWSAVGFSWDQLTYFLFNPFLKETGWLVVLVVLVLAFKKIPDLLKLQLLFSFLSLGALSRNGGAENYYMEFILYGLLAVGEGWGYPNSESLWPKLTWMDWVFAFFIWSGASLFLLTAAPHVPGADEIKMKETAAQVYQKGNDHLAVDTDLPLMAGKPIWYQHSGILPIVQAGVWDPAPLIRDIRLRKFTTIEFYDIPHQYLYPPSVEQAVMENYRPWRKAFGRVWYIPLS